jgi:hypothetical protein
MINSTFMFEDIDNEILVCDTASSLVVHLTGAEAAVVRDLLHSQEPIEFTGAEQSIAVRLAEAGVVVEAELVDTDSGEPTSDFSRRKMLQLSAVGAAAAGLTVLALPTAAAAASGGPTPEPFSPGGTIPTLGSGVVPGDTFVEVGGATSPISLRWQEGTGGLFDYRWTLFLTDGTLVATGVLTSSATNTSTGEALAAGGILRFYVGDLVIDRTIEARSVPV